MYKLWATILKDIRILTRDRTGLLIMFLMPVVLVVVITAVQNSTFELVNDNKIPILLCNRDTGAAARQLVVAVEKIGMFDIRQVDSRATEKAITDRMHDKDALVALVIPADFSATVAARAGTVSKKALNDFGVKADSATDSTRNIEPINLFYHPVLQESFRASVKGALRSALQLVETREVVRTLYYSLNEKEMPPGFENEIIGNQTGINEIPVSRDGSRKVPNASQHNVPAWTIFAMFFIVISLGANVVREKLSGSFLRLRTMPTHFALALVSKQLTYLLVTLLQSLLIFSLGIWLFPHIGLPALNLPADKIGLLVVCIACGWCAVSYAICVGVIAQTQEQANGFGAISIILMAAVGGILVPSFAMPASFQGIMRISPLHWCLEAFYGLFLEEGKLKDVILKILPLLGITLLIQILTAFALKRKNLI